MPSHEVISEFSLREKALHVLISEFPLRKKGLHAQPSEFPLRENSSHVLMPEFPFREKASHDVISEFALRTKAGAASRGFLNSSRDPELAYSFNPALRNFGAITRWQYGSRLFSR
jgi:hypothetical protein